MSYGFLDIAVTPAVREAQAERGVDHVWKDFKGHREFNHFGEDEAAFIASRDSFYMASVSETGWPYIQHRGGPPGFLKVVDDRSLAFADYRGNLQYISVGNVSADSRVCLFLMDYPRRTRLKIYARAGTLRVDEDRTLTELVSPVTYEAKVERVMLFRLETFDWNCPQHINPRFTESEIGEASKPLRDRLSQLESENSELRARLADLGAKK